MIFAFSTIYDKIKPTNKNCQGGTMKQLETKKVNIDNQEYQIIIERKNNKNTYLKVKEDLKIYITTNYFTTTRSLDQLIHKNIPQIKRMIETQTKKQPKEGEFQYLGQTYSSIYLNTVKDIEIGETHAFINPDLDLEKWYKKQAKPLFQQHLDTIYPVFDERIPYPKLKLRKMKTRWGVCNRKDNSITLNTELMKRRTELLDYVIIHELSHFVEFNHSANFWKVVGKYLPNYKQLRKELKNEC